MKAVRARLPRRWRDVAGSLSHATWFILAALLVDFTLQQLVRPPGSAGALLARAVLYPLGAAVGFLLGMWLGKRTWPKRGARLARYLLRRALARRSPRLLFLTDRPDFTPSLPRRLVETVGFSAGAAILISAILSLLGVANAGVEVVAGTLILVTLWASFLLVPYWIFARLGLREIDPLRWLVQPLSRRYADRLRLANGALLLIALGAVVNLAFRAGATGETALVEGVRTVFRIVASILVVAAAGVGFYARKERELLRAFRDEVLAMGIRDGRGMSDGDFLPRVRSTVAPAGEGVAPVSKSERS